MATSSGNDFLDVNPTGGESILNITQGLGHLDLDQPFELNSQEGKQVFPKPGFCIKSKTKKGEKVFINMCHSEDLPKPDEKLMSPKDACEDESIRLPLGIGYPHKEKDKSGKDCLCVDVLINTEFLNSLLKDEDARSFVLSLCIQGIADKYGILIRNDCCMKLTKPYHGTSQKYFVKDTGPKDDPFAALQHDSKSSSDFIRLMEPLSADSPTTLSVRPKESQWHGRGPPPSKEVESAAEETLNELYMSIMNDPNLAMIPKKKVEYGFFELPASESDPKRYLLEIIFQYSLIASHKQVNVTVTRNHVSVKENLRKFNLDLVLPKPIIKDQSRAHLSRGILTVVLPIDE